MEELRRYVIDDVPLDPDLSQKLDGLPPGRMREVFAQTLKAEQLERNETVARRNAMTSVERRIDRVREKVMGEPLTDADRHHIHSVIALCGMPYRRPKDDSRDVVRSYGRSSLVVQAGYLKDPNSGEMVRQGVPYGPKARLLMLHICTMAIRQKSPTIDIGDSMSAFIRDLGFAVTGGKRGTITQFKEQMNRLAASRIQLGLWNGDQSRTINSQPIESFDLWLPREPNQRILWNSTLTLNGEFYKSLKEHALPVDIRALRAFSHSARQIDIILWLSYRLPTINRPYQLAWSALAEQFGKDVKTFRRFKQDFAEDLRQVQEAFPKLNIMLTEKGLLMKPSSPEQLFIPVK
jgi:hypothetical protein